MSPASGADQIDFLKAVYGNFPLMLGLIALLTFILLARAFRSIVLPIKAILLNLVTLAATLGFMVLFWQYGHGSEAIFGVHSTGAVTFWIPLMVFAFLFGLSMDYEVFILARIREEYSEQAAPTDGAVVEGIGRTGRLVTSAALILFLAFVALASGPGTDLKIFASALGFGILLDATDRPVAAGAGPGVDVRRLELVDARLGGARSCGCPKSRRSRLRSGTELTPNKEAGLPVC